MRDKALRGGLNDQYTAGEGGADQPWRYSRRWRPRLTCMPFKHLSDTECERLMDPPRVALRAARLVPAASRSAYGVQVPPEVSQSLRACSTLSSA